MATDTKTTAKTRRTTKMHNNRNLATIQLRRPGSTKTLGGASQ